MGILESPARLRQCRKWGYSPTRRTIILGLVASLILFVMLRSFPQYDMEQPYQSPASSSWRSSQDDRPIITSDPFCVGFPRVDNIAIILKTGASESFNKIPTQLLTNMRCVSGGDFMIFSDKEEIIGGVQVHDSLDNMLPEAQADNFEFEIYRAQQNCIVDREHCFIPERNGNDDRPAGWRLDKYKNIHMAEKAWKALPDRDWYFFIDADTYVFWDTLVMWLKQMDPTRKHFLGNIHDHGTGPFAHGGSGYLLSHPAMSELLDKNPGVARQYDMVALGLCCGDLMFSQAMKEKADIEVVGVWPTLSEENFWNTPYASGSWCQPVASMHHMSAEETSLLWEFERKRYAAAEKRHTPILFRDVYLALVADRMQSPTRLDWDNWSDGWIVHGNRPPGDDWTAVQKAAHTSADNCLKACEADDGCFQWNFSWENKGTCAISWSFRLGAPTEKDKGKTSGWLLDRIERFMRYHNCGDNVDWNVPKGLP